jgi:two-component system, OmpR family, phosphate regulon response regulator PhoB
LQLCATFPSTSDPSAGPQPAKPPHISHLPENLLNGTFPALYVCISPSENGADMVFPQKTVLLVEDQADQQVFLANLLIASGYNTVFASDKAEGLHMIKTEKPDLVMIDMMMPADQGIRLYRAIKASEHMNTLPVVMLSSINKKMFFQCHQIQEPRTHKGLPVPEAYIEMPPEAEDLLRQVNALSDRPVLENQSSI